MTSEEAGFGDNVPPRFSLPRIQMQSVLDQEFTVSQCELVVHMPPIVERTHFDKKPARDKGTASAVRISELDKKLQRQRTAKLNRQLHDQHRVFFANLKLDREVQLSNDTKAAIVIQKYARRFLFQRKMNPEKYLSLRSSLQTKKWTMEEMFTMVDEAIRRSGFSDATAS